MTRRKRDLVEIIDEQQKDIARLKAALSRTVSGLYLPIGGGILTGHIDMDSYDIDVSGGTMTEEGWTAPTLLNSWVDYGAGERTTRYRKDANGVVRIEGTVKSGTTASNTQIFLLPVGYRPPQNVFFPIASAATVGAGSAKITSSGYLLARSNWHATFTSVMVAFAT